MTALSLTHNLFPSLHVAFAVTAAAVFATRGAAWRWFFGTWAAAICVFTVLTHQHHLADVAGGVALAWLCLRKNEQLFPVASDNLLSGSDPSQPRGTQ